ncbi:MAG: hypothetical protein D6757_02135 [Alphaproteobacteria bacterium]|nr:MAG: hypothetical protein D6757_02135 [Alphaproteobacteria bacterium]
MHKGQMLLGAALAVAMTAGFGGGFSDTDSGTEKGTFAHLFGVASADAAQQEKEESRFKNKKKKRVDALRQPVYEKIARAQKLMEEGDKEGARAKLLDLMDDRINDYEKAIVLQFLGQLAIEAENYKEAIPYYEQITRLERAPDNIINAATQALAQLYFANEDYTRAIDYMKRWMATQETESPTSDIFLARAYYALEDFPNVVKYAERAIQLAQQQGRKVEENWWLLLRAAYFELKNYEKVRDILEILAVTYDKPEYWRQLAAIYSELGMEDKNLAAMEVAYRRGFLEEKPRYLMSLAQLYLYHNVPIKAAWVLERALKEGKVEKSGEVYELLGQAYLNAQEMEKAEGPLRKAAELENKGELWMRLGQVLVERNKWKEAVDALQKAIDSGDLKEPAFAWVLIGTAQFNLENFKEARAAFRKASKFKETRKTARQWLKYIDSELKRRSQLTEYYDKSGRRKKRSR